MSQSRAAAILTVIFSAFTATATFAKLLVVMLAQATLVTSADGTSTDGTTFEFFTGDIGGTSIAANLQVGISKFIARIGGAGFQLTPAGYPAGHAQMAITFALIAK